MTDHDYCQVVTNLEVWRGTLSDARAEEKKIREVLDSFLPLLRPQMKVTGFQFEFVKERVRDISTETEIGTPAFRKEIEALFVLLGQCML